MAELMNNAIFWIDVDKIDPNPYQPRKEFDDSALAELADSIKQYGVLQPLVVSRQEITNDRGGIEVRYELIAGERRTRASRLAGIRQVPAIVRVGDNSKLKLELAIIENLQREDLNPIDRARAFMRLIEEFQMTHAQVGKKVGKSREYVSNSIRLLSLPTEIMDGLASKKISEGHTRPLLMLADRPDEQSALFRDIVNRKMSVRESEKIARRIAHEKVRREHLRTDPQILDLERKFSEELGTRVTIESGDHGGKIVIDYGDPKELQELLVLLREKKELESSVMSVPRAPIAATDIGFAAPVIDPVRVVAAPAPVIMESSEPAPTIPIASIIPEEKEEEVDIEPEMLEHADIDDVELDIVSNPQRDIPDHYHHIFKIPGGSISVDIENPEGV
jgi:ParB family transcriptional regulator, chromosome partitioning protein